MTEITIIFHNYLREMLKKEQGATPSFLHRFDRKASLKDVIESLGVPHPLIGKLTVNDTAVGFDYILRHGDIVEAIPLTPPVNPLVPTILRPEPLDRFAFVVDVNVGKLAIYLRTLGFDTVYDSSCRDFQLATIAHDQKRILLTRDTSLLKRKIIMHGYLPREEKPFRQILEIVRLYDLGSRFKPLTRCIPCNGLLVPVTKNAVLPRLEPLTRKYYHSFHICPACNRIYWAGSHQEKIVAFVRQVCAAVGQEDPAAESSG